MNFIGSKTLTSIVPSIEDKIKEFPLTIGSLYFFEEKARISRPPLSPDSPSPKGLF
jgi:hypothetical protein